MGRARGSYGAHIVTCSRCTVITLSRLEKLLARLIERLLIQVKHSAWIRKNPPLLRFKLFLEKRIHRINLDDHASLFLNPFTGPLW